MKNFKSQNLIIKLTTMMLFVLLLCVGIFSLPIKSFANAETFVDYTVEDGKFSMKMTANGRKSVALPIDKRTVKNSANEDIDYYFFQWRDIESLKFTFSASLQGSTRQYKSYKFLLTNVQTDDLTTILGQTTIGGKFSTLCQGNISSNNFSKFDFNFYIDKTSDITETATRCKGNDFGLYKFDFIYTYIEDGEEISRNIGNSGQGDIYVAILPDDIDSIEQDDTKILYSVSSSNKLMNIFNLYLSTDTYKYVNPKYLQWTVVGTDKTNLNYVYSQQMKDDNINYANYKAIWQSPPTEPNGTSFIFDSNDIEGEWTAYCTIKNTNGSEKINLVVSNLSTVKLEEKSYLWLIVLLICVALILFATITLIILYKKKEKIW
jgi:hypothetical protein